MHVLRGIRIVALFGLLLMMRAGAWAGENFVPQGLETFREGAWSGITLGVTTQDGLKKQFANGRGQFPASVELKQPKDAPVRVDALFPSKDKKATLNGVCLTYSGEGADAAPIIAALGEGMTEGYLTERLEDWKIVSYPQKGVLLFIVKNHVQRALLGTPEKIAAALSGPGGQLSASATLVVKQVDPHAGEPRIMEFGEVIVNYNVTGIRIKDQDKDKMTLEDRMRKATAAGAIKYAPGASGTYTTSVDIAYDADKGGTLSVSAYIKGDVPYGPVKGSGSSNLSLPSEAKGGVGSVYGFGYAATVADAMNKAERDIFSDVRIKGPPPIEAARLAFWQGMLDRFRGDTQLSR